MPIPQISFTGWRRRSLIRSRLVLALPLLAGACGMPPENEGSPEPIRQAVIQAGDCTSSTSGDCYPEPSLAERANPPLTDVLDGSNWETSRRPALLGNFRKYQHGHYPVGTTTSDLPPNGRPFTMSFTITSGPTDVVVTDPTNSANTATVTENRIRIDYTGPGGSRSIRLYQYLPKTSGRKKTVLLLYHGLEENLTPNATSKEVFPIYNITSKGYAAVGVLSADVDRASSAYDPVYGTSGTEVNWSDGVHGAFPETRDAESWGTIGAWAWGASRAMDYLETDRSLDAGKVVVVGHSRSGKTALWAGAQDTRFAMVVSSQSGTGGHAFARLNWGASSWGGETIKQLNDRFPTWFSGNFKNYNGNESALPVDAHQLIAMIAPRPISIGCAGSDNGDDNQATFAAAQGAHPVWQSVYGLSGFNGTTAMSKVPYASDTAVYHNGYIGYHRRVGEHGLTVIDWNHHLKLADLRLTKLWSPKFEVEFAQTTSGGGGGEVRKVRETTTSLSNDWAVKFTPPSGATSGNYVQFKVLNLHGSRTYNVYVRYKKLSSRGIYNISLYNGTTKTADFGDENMNGSGTVTVNVGQVTMSSTGGDRYVRFQFVALGNAADPASNTAMIDYIQFVAQ